MAEPYKNQHIVPVSYINRFATKGQKEYIIYTRCKSNGLTVYFQSSTDKVGFIKNFYDVTDKSDPKHWEKHLANTVDALCANEVDSIIESVKNTNILTDKHKEILSSIIIAQTLRIPANYEHFKDVIYPRIFEDTMLKYGVSNSKEDHFKFSSDELKNEYFNAVFDNSLLKLLSTVLQRKEWNICINSIRNRIPFITSDNPVLFEDTTNNGSIGVYSNGLLPETTTIYFPLTPSVAVVINGKKRSTNESDVFYTDNEIFINSKNKMIMDQAFHHTFIPNSESGYLQDSNSKL